MKRLALILFLAASVLAQDKPRIWVHAPAEDLLSLFPEKGAGFLISLDEYRKLVALAKANEAANKEQPPLAARLVRGGVTARIDGETMRLEANYVAVVQGDRPAEIPFPLQNIALERIAVEGGELAGSSLRFAKAGTYSVTATLSARIARKGELRRVAFRLPPAAAHTVRVALPAGVQGEVGPIVRAFRSGEKGGAVVGFPDGRGLFKLWYTPRAPAQALDPLLSAAVSTIAEIGEARTIISTQLDLEVMRAPVRTLDVLLGAGQTIRALQGKGVKSWRVVRGNAGVDRLEIRFVDPVEGKVSLRIEAELPRTDATTAPIPIPRVSGAARFRGSVGINPRSEVRLTGIDAEGARRLDGRSGAIALYEIWSQDARITATVERVEAKTRAQTRALLAFREGGKSIRVAFTYRIAGQPLFRLEPHVPAGWILRHIHLNGRAVPHRYEDDGRVVLDFPAGLKPGVHVLDLRLDTDEVDWVPNTGTVTFEAEGIRSGLEEETGVLVVAADQAFRVATTTTQGLQTIGMPEIVRAGFKASDQLLYGWRFDQPNYVARFSLERHTPQINATVLHRLLASERLLKVHASVLLDIQRTGVRELKIALPKGTGPLVDFRGPLIKEKRAPAADADPEEWTLVFQSRVRGKYRLEVLFDRKFEDDAWDAPVPEITLPGVSDRGFLVVHTSGTTAISVARNGMREADVDELPEQPQRPPLEVLAYGSHPYDVRIASKRHDPQEVVQAVALSAHIYGVVSHEGKLRCRAEYRVRNNDQPFLSCVLPSGSVLLGAIVDGKPIKPLVEKGVLKLTMPRSKNREAPFVVALIYEGEVEELETSGEITIDRPVLDVDVLKTRYTLHLPSGYELTGHDGDLVPLSMEERETVLESVLGSAIEIPAAFDAGPDLGEVAQRYTTDVGEKQSANDQLKNDLDQVRDQVNTLQAQNDTSALRDRIKNLKEMNDASRPDADEDMEVEESTVEAEKAEKGLAADKKKAQRKKGGRSGSFRGPNGGVPPGNRDPSDPAAEPAPSEDAPARKPKARAGGKFVAHGGKEGKPSSGPSAPGKEERARPEKALLSLDIQFLRPDNLVRLDSLAPTGKVTLSYKRREIYQRQHFLGVVLGAAVALIFVIRRVSLLRLLPGTLLVIFALQFAGLSFLPADFARGAGEAIAVVFVLALLLALFRAASKITWLRRRKRIVAPLLLLAAFANAQEPDEILVPYKDDPGKIERVFLPADVYHRLRRLAFPETAGRATVVSDADYEVALKGEELTVTVKYAIVKETDETERIALGLKDVAVTRAVLDDKPATLAVEKGGYVLVLKGKGRSSLELTLRPDLAAKGERRTFAFPVRPVAGARLKLAHDRTGHEVMVASLGAQDDGLYHLGPVGFLAATWIPKTESFVAATAELRAQTETMIAVRDGYTGVAARIRYGISGGTVDRLRVRVGRDLSVRAVKCANLAGWQIDREGNLVVALSKPAEKALVLELAAERPAQRERTEEIPVVAPLDVLRDAGVIALETLPDLKIEVLQSQGLLRGRANQAPRKLPAAHDKGVVRSVHRYAVRPFQLKWRVFLEKTRLRAQTRVDLYLERDVAYADVNITVEVERGPGPFSIPVTLPSGGYEVQTVQGPVRDWWVRDGVLTLDLVKRQPRTAAYRVVLRRRAQTAEALEAPALAVRGAVRESGVVRIAVADGLELEAGDAANLLPEDIAKVGKMRWGRLVRAYRFVSVPWRLVVSTREEPREMDAIVVSRVIPLADRIRVEALVNFHVRRGLVDRFSFVVPDGDALVSATDLREERSEAVEGGRRYTLLLRTPTRGSAAATVAYHLPYGTRVRGVEPLGVERTRRFVAIEKIPDGEVRATSYENLDAGDFDDLPLVPPGSSQQTVAGVGVGSGGPYSFELEVKRHTFEEVAKAVVYRAAAQAVVERSGWARVVVSYRVYNRSKQFLRLRLPDESRLYSVLVAGQGVRPLGEGKDLLVPLRKLALGATTFEVEVVYGYRRSSVDDEQFAVNLPDVIGLGVRRTTLTLYVPAGFDYSFDTTMEEVDETYLAAGEADDIYQEIKELYSVAERGNKLQVRRALTNFALLERQAKRAIDEVRSNTRDRQQLDQVEAQERKLRALADNLVQQSETQNARFKADTRLGKDMDRNTQAKDWAANRGWLESKQGQARKQVVEFANKQRELQAGRPQAGGQIQDALQGTAGAGEGGPTTPQFRAGQQGGKAPQLGATIKFDGLTTSSAGDDAKLPQAGLFFTDGADGDWRGAQEGRYDAESSKFIPPVITANGGADYTPQQLRSAKGRISIRIDLPLEGEVYHFARLGADGGVSFDASETDGSLLEGFLALLFAAGAVTVLTYRFKK